MKKIDEFGNPMIDSFHLNQLKVNNIVEDYNNTLDECEQLMMMALV
jgi:hypothetical protein